MSRALLLTGGGARAAYQAGVLRRILEVSRAPEGRLPWDVLVGVSAGAINLAALAVNASSFTTACEVMDRHWRNVTTERVFHTSAGGLLLNAGRWLFDLLVGGALDTYSPKARALADTAPLAALLRDLIPEGAIDRQLDAGILKAVAVTATDYSSGALTVFVHSRSDRTLWQRYSRHARYDRITPSHVLASCSLPMLFPAVRIGSAYYGDGSIRNSKPISPAVHLGARKVMAIGVRCAASIPVPTPPSSETPSYPTPARITGTLLNAVFYDALEEDREQLTRINGVLERLSREERTRLHLPWRPVDFLYLGPSRDLGHVAQEHRAELPRSVRHLLRGLGTEVKGGADLLSYLLFESGYCRALLELGYEDARARSDEITAFVEG
jgi:NTE family protein